MSIDTKFAKPTEIDAARAAFPANVSDLMPDRADIPEDFRNPNSSNPWIKFQRDWFFNGIKKADYRVKDGLDESAVWRHLAAIQGSWEPKHEHKEAAVAYLASLWLVAA